MTPLTPDQARPPASDWQRQFEAVVARLKAYPLRPPFERPARYAMLLRGWSAAQLHALVDDCVSRRVPPRVLREHLCRARPGEMVPEEFTIVLRAVADADGVPPIVHLRRLLKRALRVHGLKCIHVAGRAGAEIDLSIPLPATDPAGTGTGEPRDSPGLRPRTDAVQVAPEASGCGAVDGVPAGQTFPSAGVEIGGCVGEMRAVGGAPGAHRSQSAEGLSFGES